MTVNTIFEKLQPLCDYLEKSIREELQRQGHVATGKLSDSIRVAVYNEAYGISIQGTALSHAKYVDWGRLPGGKRVPIEALLAWIEVKGLAQGKKAISLAWAIQYSIWKNGVPTNKDEDRKGFVTRTLEGNKAKIFSDVHDAVEQFYSIELINIIREVKSKEYGGN